MAGARALTLDLLLRAEAAGQYADRALSAALDTQDDAAGTHMSPPFGVYPVTLHQQYLASPVALVNSLSVAVQSLLLPPY